MSSSCSTRTARSDELDEGLFIYWGAYLGTEDEVLISGTIGECGETIAEVRAAARTRKGWIFDTYLLRRLDD